jgi:hypothetical protein
MKNLPDEFQRQHIVDRGSGGLVVQAKLVDVVHGELGPNKEPASLIITDFTFTSTSSKNSRRFTSAVISYNFTSMTSTDPWPVVMDIAPKGYFSIEPPQETIKATGSPDLSVQAGDAKANISSKLLWSLHESKATAGHATLTGTIRRRTARWSLRESDIQKEGIPSSLRTATLLRRKKDERFQATVEIETSADIYSSFSSGIARSFGKTAKDDPIIFDPSMPPMGNLTDIDEKNLLNTNWKELGIVSSTGAVFSDTAKGKVAWHTRLYTLN